MHAALALLVLAVSPRWGFEDAYDNVAGGDWYIGQNNETANLAWGESYVLWSLMAMLRTTEHPRYADRLIAHADALLAQRDDARGVADYRGVSGACWRNTSYQKNGEPYCYAVHSGMLVYPLADFARFVAGWRHKDALGPGGQTYAARAAAYAAAAAATAAYHDDEWSDAGYYFFRGDATFLDFAGQDLPFNQSNAMGLALLALHDATGDPAYLSKAGALAQRMRAMMTEQGGNLLWNYWGGPYQAPGEDISHAAINVAFAVSAAASGVGFTDADLDAIAATFVDRVYRDDSVFSDFLGGGADVNGDAYRAQIGRWLPLAPRRAAVYTAVHDAFVRDYPPAAIGSGSVLLGWAYLAEHEPPVCPHFFYPHDWQDAGDHMVATAYGANVLAVPPDLAGPCRIPLTVKAARRAVAAQWDGQLMHRGAEWQPGPDFAPRSVPYEPRWPLVYFEDGVLFEFQDDFAADEAIRVMKPAASAPPAITSSPPGAGEVGVPLTYAPTGVGDPPFWWSLREGPLGLAVDPATGEITWTPAAPGEALFTLVLENDLGEAVQQFTVEVPAPGGSSSSGDSGDDATSSGGEASAAPTTGGSSFTAGPDASSGATGTGPSATGGGASEGAGCACDGVGAPGLALLVPLARRRRRSPAPRLRTT